MTSRLLHITRFGILLLLALACPVSAWEKTTSPTYEGPPWGEDRYQHLAVRIGIGLDGPMLGASGTSPAPYAPRYDEGWIGGTGGFIDLAYFFCPGHALLLCAQRFNMPSAGPVTVGTETHEFGAISGTAVAIGWGVHLPLMLETELWTCTLAPTTKGPVIYGRFALGLAQLDELSLTVTPAPATGNPPWWEASLVPFAMVAGGFEFRPIRYVGVFGEIQGAGFLPKAGSAWPGSSDAGNLIFMSLRAGVSVLFL